MKLYHDTNKELFFKQYKPLPVLDGMDIKGLYGLIDNLLSAFDNSQAFGSDLLSVALYDDIVAAKRHFLKVFTVTLSPDMIASIIRVRITKYSDIYKALRLFIEYQEKASDESIFNQSIDYCGLCQLIKGCFEGSAKA